MDFSKFKDVNINVKKITVKLNTGAFDMYTPLYSTTAKFDGCTHKISVLRCGYLGLTFLLIDDVPTFQLYGSHQTIAENINSLNLSDEIIQQINRYTEYNDWKKNNIGGLIPPIHKEKGNFKMNKIVIYTHNGEILIVANADNVDLLCEYVGLLTNIPFPKCDFSCYIDNSEDKIYAVSIRKGR